MIKNVKFLMCVIFMSIVCSCNQQSVDRKAIVGKWKVIKFKAKMNDVSPFVIKSAEEIALSSSYEFKEDSTYSFNSSFESYNGTWSLENKNITMTFSSEYEKDGLEEFEIVSLNNEEMIWKIEFELGKTETVLSKK